MTWALIVAHLRSAWTWVKSNTGFLLLLLIGMTTGAKLLRRKDSQISTLKEALDAEKHKTEIERYKERALGLEKLDQTSVARDKVLVEEVQAAEAKATEHKRKLLALHDKHYDVASMTDAEIEERFRAAGL